jgi:hypothetical protein
LPGVLKKNFTDYQAPFKPRHYNQNPRESSLERMNHDAQQRVHG